MRVIHGTRSLDAPLASSVLTIGNFDGVHLGHRALLKRMTDRAKAIGVPAVVLTFDPHPVKVLYPDRGLNRIFDLTDQEDQIESCGADMLVIEPFSREFSQLPADRFVLDWIFKPFVPDTVVVGYDFSFGANRQGSIEFLQERGRALGFKVDVVAPVKVNEVLASSSRIRQAVESGDVVLAHDLLGRDFYLHGVIEKGDGRGRTIGVPTANLRTNAETMPARGVYAAIATIGGRDWPAAVNVGYNPTFKTQHGSENSKGLFVEAHLLGFSGDIYGDTMELAFKARLRDEKKFASVAELVAQIHRDIDECKAILRAGS